MLKKLRFSMRESGVGGSFVVVPIASWAFGGDLGRRVRMWLFMEVESGKTYWRGC